jgi:undecaprenyl pyrophosphate synthase
MEKRAIERILNGIRLIEEGVYFQELEHLRRLNRDLQLETARAEKNEERATDARVNLQVNNGARAIDDGDPLGGGRVLL